MDEMHEHYRSAKVDERAAGQLPQKWKNTFNISSSKLEMPPAVWESLSQGESPAVKPLPGCLLWVTSRYSDAPE
jgi:hypothetical protein